MAKLKTTFIDGDLYVNGSVDLADGYLNSKKIVFLSEDYTETLPNSIPVMDFQGNIRPSNVKEITGASDLTYEFNGSTEYNIDFGNNTNVDITSESLNFSVLSDRVYTYIPSTDKDKLCGKSLPSKGADGTDRTTAFPEDLIDFVTSN